MQVYPHTFDHSPRSARSGQQGVLLHSAALAADFRGSDGDDMLVGGDFGLPFPAGQHPGSPRKPRPVKLAMNYAVAIVLLSWTVMFWPLVALLTASAI